MKFEISKDEYKNGSPKRYRVELSLTGMLGLGTVLVLGLVWVFIFGVLVGRGYQPEKAVPELARIMPEGGKKAQKDSGVIQPEELTFLDKLRDEPERKAPGRDAEARQQLAKETSPEQQVSDPRGQAAEQSGTSEPEAAGKVAMREGPEARSERGTVQEAQEPEPVAVAAGETTAEPAAQKAGAASSPAGDAVAQAGAGREEKEDIDQTTYNYVYQVASLSEPESALRFRDKVRKLGLRSEVKVIRGEKKYWHRVVVLFQGRPMDTREMKARLKTLGVEKPLLRSKVPVS